MDWSNLYDRDYRNRKEQINFKFKFATYQMEPHENAARRYPLSHIERAVGEFNPIVSIY